MSFATSRWLAGGQGRQKIPEGRGCPLSCLRQRGPEVGGPTNQVCAHATPEGMEYVLSIKMEALP